LIFKIASSQQNRDSYQYKNNASAILHPPSVLKADFAKTWDARRLPEIVTQCDVGEANI
jgi:hypothetical protein